MRPLKANTARARVAALLLTCAVAARATEPEAAPERAAVGRVVHRFDFDERSQGNIETIPRYWEPLRAQGLPHFARGGFDLQTGHDAAPSFHLKSDGRGVAFSYSGPETPVRANSDYRVEAHVRPDRLVHARACFSACYMDEHGWPLTQTLVRSRYIGGDADGDKWAHIELMLPPAPRDARTIGLGVWVLQDSQWNLGPRLRRHIPRVDIEAGVWVDDIGVFRLPRAGLASPNPANLFEEQGPKNLLVTFSDHDDASLRGQFTIRGADGLFVESRQLAVVLEQDARPIEIGVGQLIPGVYEARLEVFEKESLIVTRTLVFARLGPRLGPPATGRRFGIVVDPAQRAPSEAETRLLLAQLVRSVKLPLWSGLADEPHTDDERTAGERMLFELARAGFSLTGVLAGPPAELVRTRAPYVPGLAELLTSDAAAWSDHLSMVAAPNAGTFGWWQVGADGGRSAYDEPKTAEALERVREALKKFITTPRLAAPVRLESVGTQRLSVEEVTIQVGSGIGREQIAAAVQSARHGGYGRVAAYVEPLGREFQRGPRLADWALRVLVARHAGADVVYLPQTWLVRETELGATVDPDEGFVALRTLADVLGDAAPGPELRLSSGAHALAFVDGSRGVIALWDPAAPPEGREHQVALGAATRVIDLWGRASPISRDDRGRATIRLSGTPVLVEGIEPWLLALPASVRLTPNHVEAGRDTARLTLEIGYRATPALGGQVRIRPASGWRVTPREFLVQTAADGVQEFPLEFRLPPGEPAGMKTMMAEISLSQNDYAVEIPLRVDVGLADVDAWGTAAAEGDRLVVRHTVTNRSGRPLSFRASAAAPGRERQYRPIPSLRSGETQSLEYRFEHGAELAGKVVRLALRESNDGPRVHHLEVLAP